MNNLTFGNARFTYYETIAGGQGACPDADGPSAVHVAMSNTLNTPVEALELAYPLRVERYALRARLRRGRAASGAATACQGDHGPRALPRLDRERAAWPGPEAAREAASRARPGGISSTGTRPRRKVTRALAGGSSR